MTDVIRSIHLDESGSLSSGNMKHLIVRVIGIGLNDSGRSLDGIAAGINYRECLTYLKVIEYTDPRVVLVALGGNCEK